MAATCTYVQGAKASREIFLRPWLLTVVPSGLRLGGTSVGRNDGQPGGRFTENKRPFHTTTGR